MGRDDFLLWDLVYKQPLRFQYPDTHISSTEKETRNMNDEDDEEQTRLPDDFDIDLPISILTDIVLTRVPLSIQFYNLITRLENERAVKRRRMYT